MPTLKGRVWFDPQACSRPKGPSRKPWRRGEKSFRRLLKGFPERGSPWSCDRDVIVTLFSGVQFVAFAMKLTLLSALFFFPFVDSSHTIISWAYAIGKGYRIDEDLKKKTNAALCGNWFRCGCPHFLHPLFALHDPQSTICLHSSVFLH